MVSCQREVEAAGGQNVDGKPPGQLIELHSPTLLRPDPLLKQSLLRVTRSVPDVGDGRIKVEAAFDDLHRATIAFDRENGAQRRMAQLHGTQCPDKGLLVPLAVD